MFGDSVRKSLRIYIHTYIWGEINIYLTNALNIGIHKKVFYHLIIKKMHIKMKYHFPRKLQT